MEGRRWFGVGVRGEEHDGRPEGPQRGAQEPRDLWGERVAKSGDERRGKQIIQLKTTEKIASC